MSDVEMIDLPFILSPKPVRKTGKTARSVLLTCKVCLGKATGHHYNVASCNGCKSFFRRVITGNLIYTCLARSQCYDHLVPGGSAPKCRSCRFNKCVKMGMNPLAIQSEIRKLNGKHTALEISKEARETLFVERKKYTMALLNHTMAGHGSAGPGRFAELLNIIDVLERQQKDQRDVYLLINLCRSKPHKIPLFDDVLLCV